MLLNIVKFNDLQLKNIQEIIKLKIPHLCINTGQYYDLLGLQEFKKGFYEYFDLRNFTKAGFLNNGKTSLWISGNLKEFNVKISSQYPKDGDDECWSAPLSFSEKDSPMIIYKMIKYRMFW